MLEFEAMDDLNDIGANLTTVKHFTVRSRVNREKRNEWFNSEFRVLRRGNILKYKKAGMENSINAWRKYKAPRNLYKVKEIN